RANNIHWMRGLGELFDGRKKRGAYRAHFAQSAGEIRELLGAGKLAVPQQVSHFLKGGMLGQLVHGISAIDQRAGFAGHLRNRGAVNDDAIKAFGDGRHSRSSRKSKYDTKARRNEAHEEKTRISFFASPSSLWVFVSHSSCHSTRK